MLCERRAAPAPSSTSRRMPPPNPVAMPMIATPSRSSRRSRNCAANSAPAGCRSPTAEKVSPERDGRRAVAVTRRIAATRGDTGAVPIYRDEAVVLRTHKLGEADRIVTMLSRQHGKIRAVAKGVRRTGVEVRRAARAVHGRRRAALRGPHASTSCSRPSRSARTAPTSSPTTRSYTAANAMVETADRLTDARGGPAAVPAAGRRAAVAGAGASTRPAAPSTPTCCARSRSRAGRRASSTARSPARPGRTRPSSSQLGGVVADAVAPPGAPRLDAGDPRAARRPARGRLGRAPRPPTSARRNQASGVVAAYTQWHLERGLRSLEHLDRVARAGTTP